LQVPYRKRSEADPSNRAGSSYREPVAERTPEASRAPQPLSPGNVETNRAPNLHAIDDGPNAILPQPRELVDPCASRSQV